MAQRKIKPPKGFKPTSKFDQQQISMFVESMVDRVGGRDAWNFVGPAIREMAVEAQAYKTMAAQTFQGATFTAQDMHQVRWDIGVFTGVIDPEDY